MCKPFAATILHNSEHHKCQDRKWRQASRPPLGRSCPKLVPHPFWCNQNLLKECHVVNFLPERLTVGSSLRKGQPYAISRSSSLATPPPLPLAPRPPSLLTLSPPSICNPSPTTLPQISALPLALRCRRGSPVCPPAAPSLPFFAPPQPPPLLFLHSSLPLSATLPLQPFFKQTLTVGFLLQKGQPCVCFNSFHPTTFPMCMTQCWLFAAEGAGLCSFQQHACA